MDIRAERTRRLLKDAFQQLLEEKSFEGISVSEICALSTVRRGTFYRHFDDKYAFYEWYLQSITQDFLAELDDDIDDADLRAYLSFMHRKLIAFEQEHRESFGHNLGKTALAGSLDMVMKEIADGIAERIGLHAAQSGIELDATPQLLSMFYSGGMVHTLRWWLLNGEPCSAEELERHCTDFLMRYLEMVP